mgnify:FL=1
MVKAKRTLCAAVALVCVIYGCVSMPVGSQPPQSSRSQLSGRASRMVSGDQGLQNVTRLLSQVPWYTNMDYARNKAAKEDKPIFWVHMLGPMNGAT